MATEVIETKERVFAGCQVLLKCQGDKTFQLSKNRQEKWLSRIKREAAKYPNICVCSDHFVFGSPFKLYDVDNLDWALSLKLGYKTNLEKRLFKGMPERGLHLMASDSSSEEDGSKENGFYGTPVQRSICYNYLDCEILKNDTDALYAELEDTIEKQ